MTTDIPFHRRRPVQLGALALILVLGGAAWSLGHPMRRANVAGAREPASTGKADAKAQPKVQVTTVRVRRQDVPVLRAGIGTVNSMATVAIRARVDGQLEKVGFVEGQDVKAGQLLAQIDPRTLQAQLAQVQATRAKDRALLGNARADLQRYTTLIGQDAATQQQVDTQKALVAQLEAAVQTDDAAVQYAQVQLGFTRIVAPMDGRAGARLVDPGNIVHASDTTALVVINQIDPIAVQFTLPEEAVQDINRAQRQSAQPLAVTAYDRGGTTLLGTGRLILLNNQIDTTNGTVQLKGSFANPSRSLWPGQYVNVRLQLGRRSDALTVPAGAVQRSQDGTYVWTVADDGTAADTPVHVAQIADGVAVIDQGLNADQRVVVDGQYKLKPNIGTAEAPAAAPPAARTTTPGSAR